jgi:four helix bundle protein
MAHGAVQSHKDLRVWKESMQLAVTIYRVTRRLPAEERFGLTSQIRRAAASVAANIAEGAGRGSSREFARIVMIANGSLSELETHLLLCQELGFLSEVERIHETIKLIRTMLTRLNRSLTARRVITRL